MASQRSGSVKEIVSTDDTTLEFEFSDRISVFDKPIPSIIPGKGATLCAEGVYWFNRARELGIHTHFIEQTAPNRMKVHKVEIIREYARITPETTNYLIPLEFIARHYVAGSLYDRIRKGKLSAQDVGFPAGHAVQYGEKLPAPYVETSTKLERIDRLLTPDEALAISGLTPEDYVRIIDTILAIDRDIEAQVAQRGLIHVDGKKEFAFDENRRLMVIDVYGTADEDRFWDLAAWEQGTIIELSKEFVRKYYESIGYKEALYGARERGDAEPDIAPLPDDIIEKAAAFYKELKYKITGVE